MKSLSNKLSLRFVIWLIVGIVIYTAVTSAFTALSEKYVCTIGRDVFETGAEEAEITDEGLILGNNPKFYLYGTNDFKANYFDINISSISVPYITARLYYSDINGEFNNYTEFYIAKGNNEIKINNAMFYRLDLTNSNSAIIDIEYAQLRAGMAPVYVISNSIVIFAAVWLLLYFLLKNTGVFTALADKKIYLWAVAVAEGLFALLMLLIIFYSFKITEFRTQVFILTPLAGFMVLWLYIHSERESKNFTIPAVIVLMAIGLCIAGYFMIGRIYTDAAVVYQGAWEIAEHGRVNTQLTGFEPYSWFFKGSNNDYFVRYPNNIFILAVFALFYKFISLFGVTSGDILANYLSIILNICFITAGVIFGVLTAKNLFGKKGALAFALMSLLFVPYYINTFRFYTDTVSMPFVTFALWIYSSEDTRFKNTYIKYILIGIALGIGALIKGSILVIPVALMIQLALMGIKNLRYAAVSVIVVIAVSMLWNTYTKNCSWIDRSSSDSLEFPYVHWVMMGFNTVSDGGYSQEDFEYTDSYGTKEEKKKADMSLLRERIAGFGNIGGVMDYSLARAAGTWCDGQYMQYNHIEWGMNRSTVYDFLVKDREHYSIYKIYIQVFAYILFMLCAAGALLRIRSPRADYAMFLRLTVLGAMLFFMLWESKSRYVLNFMPVVMLSAIYGLREIKAFILQHENRMK